MRSTVFVNQGVGDVIMHLPLVRALASEANDEVLVVTRSAYEQGVVSIGVTTPGTLRFAYVSKPNESKATAAFRLLREVRNHRPQCVVLGLDVHPHFGALFALLSGARERIGPAAPASKHLFSSTLPARDPTKRDSAHNVLRVCELAALAGRKAEPTVRIPMSTDRIDELVRPLTGDNDKPMVGIALGSGPKEPHKRLPPHRAMELVATICEELPSIRPVLLGGPPEVELNAALARLPNFSGIDLTGRTPPETLLGVLASCKAVVTVCNGISHFAAAAGARIIQVSGPTNRHVTGPYGVDTRYVSRNLACSPCYRRGFRYGCGKPVCMDISADPILVALKSAIYNR